MAPCDGIPSHSTETIIWVEPCPAAGRAPSRSVTPEVIEPIPDADGPRFRRPHRYGPGSINADFRLTSIREQPCGDR